MGWVGVDVGVGVGEGEGESVVGEGVVKILKL